jgi:hypothetical protein
MELEKKVIKLLNNTSNIIETEIILYEESPDNSLLVQLEITINKQKINFKGENFFLVLLDLRKYLEKNNIQILCYGAAKNVYPSSMQLNMGVGRKAYKTYLGQSARNIDIVDIFDYEDGIEYVNVMEQEKFHNEWIKKIMG